MFDAINNVVGAISGVLYQPWCVPLILLLGGLILTIRSKFIQGRMFTEMFKVVTEKPKTEGGISSFGALMVSTASRVGTGNIIGVTSAIAVGGAGAFLHIQHGLIPVALSAGVCPGEKEHHAGIMLPGNVCPPLHGR